MVNIRVTVEGRKAGGWPDCEVDGGARRRNLNGFRVEREMARTTWLWLFVVTRRRRVQCGNERNEEEDERIL